LKALGSLRWVSHYMFDLRFHLNMSLLVQEVKMEEVLIE
jgi:hypothetical protein